MQIGEIEFRLINFLRFISMPLAKNYSYGFNGKEDDKDISEGGQDYGMRIYDSRVGRFLSV